MSRINNTVAGPINRSNLTDNFSKIAKIGVTVNWTSDCILFLQFVLKGLVVRFEAF